MKKTDKPVSVGQPQKLTADVVLRPYRTEDLEACREIAGNSTDYAHVVDESADAMEVAIYQDTLIGFSFLQVWSWNQVAWLGDIIVADDWRGCGIGRALLSKMEQRAREAGCRVIMDHPPTNHPVVHFYLSQGYRMCGYNDTFFPGENPTALFLCKALPPPE